MKCITHKLDLWKKSEPRKQCGVKLQVNKLMKVIKTDVQGENKFKMVMKREIQAVNNNYTTGASRINIPFEEDLSKISALDGSIEPEVLLVDWNY